MTPTEQELKRILGAPFRSLRARRYGAIRGFGECHARMGGMSVKQILSVMGA